MNEWLRSGRGFPSDGVGLKVRYCSGSKSSHNHLATIGSFIADALGCSHVFQGSLNFYAKEAVGLPEPARERCGNEEWLFVPVIINEAAVGLAARRPPPLESDFIEVFACDELAPRLGLTFGDETNIRLLSGSYLSIAA